METFAYAFALLNLVTLVVVPFLVTGLAFRYVKRQRALQVTDKEKLEFNIDNIVAHDVATAK